MQRPLHAGEGPDRAEEDDVTVDPRSGWEALLAAMATRRLAVVGDVALDEYLVGRAERLSREAPVPVLALSARWSRPGGAANPAWNAAVLGAEARLVALVGDDAAGAALRTELVAEKIDITHVLVDAARPTTVKTRVVAEGLSAPQQVARIDVQDRAPAGPLVEARLVAAVAEAGRGTDAVLVSHYRSGVVTAAVAAAARDAARREGALATVDAQGDVERFAGFDVVRIGRQDAAANLGRRLESEEDFRAAAHALRADLGARIVLIGRGAAGTSLLGDDGYALVPPAGATEVFDVSGAGDTMIAWVTLALAAGAAPLEAVRLATAAAGIVVRRLGVAAPTAREVLGQA